MIWWVVGNFLDCLSLQFKDDYLYLLKWQGYSDEDNTWEPSANLFCTELLDDYRRKHNLLECPQPNTSSQPPSSQSTLSKCKDVRNATLQSTCMSNTCKSLSSRSNDGSCFQWQDYSKKQKHLVTNDTCTVQKRDHCVQNTGRKRRLRLRKTRRKALELIVSINLKNGVSLFNKVYDEKEHSQSTVIKSIDTHTTSMTTTGELHNHTAHELFCYKHDHTYSHQKDDLLIEPLQEPSHLVMTPPSSAEPFEDDNLYCLSAPSCTSAKPLTMDSVYRVEISPPASPDAIPCSAKFSPPPPLAIGNPSDLSDTETADSESALFLSDEQMPNLSSPRDSLKLYLSPTSSDLDVCASDDSDCVEIIPPPSKPLQPPAKPREDISHPSERFTSSQSHPHKVAVLPSNNESKTHSRREKMLQRWRKGPLPLPRSFSKRCPFSSQLKTNAAKVQYSTLVLPKETYKAVQRYENAIHHKPYSNGFSRQLVDIGHHHTKKKLSLQGKSKPYGLKPKTSCTSSLPSNNENHSEQVNSHPEQPCISVMRISMNALSCEFTAIYEYKEQVMNWQYELNKQRDGTDDIIYVENDIDMSPLPLQFNYICSNIYNEGVPNPSHPEIINSLCGCECYYLGRKCGPKSEYCCAHMAGSKFAYTPAGKVRVPPGTPIYECNAKCSCPSDCSNRVVQLGRKIPLCIFRTNGRGWGVRTIEPIKPNTFVTEYVGEVITNEEAERRGKKYDAEGTTYLFDLDFEDDNSAFTVDAAKYGNISHFFNHSVS